MLRRLFMSNSILYKFWFNFFSTGKSLLPIKNDLFYFGGHPRSGNSYFTNILKEVYPDFKFSHHLHTIGAIKLAFKAKIPVIIIVREPLECISSLYVMNNSNNQLDNELINKYIEYHKFLLAKENLIEVVVFEKLINNPQLILDSLKKANIRLEIKEKDYDTLQKLVQSKFLKKKQLKMSDTHALRFSSTPNESRTNLKKVIKKELIKNPHMDKANHLFKSLNRIYVL